MQLWSFKKSSWRRATPTQPFFGAPTTFVESDLPDTLPQRSDSTNVVGDQKNSWVGVALLQEIFLKDHNYIADEIAKRYPSKTDEEIFQASRCVVCALVAKIHTIDWTVELLKTRMLKVAMNTNWYGVFYAIGHVFRLFDRLILSPLGLAPFRKIKKEADNKGVPFCLTEEFAAVYRLHPLIPPGLVVETKKGTEKFFSFEKLFGDEGRKTIRESECSPAQLWESVLKYPCGALTAANYPDTLRKLTPSNEEGKNLPRSQDVDLAAVDLYRDRERGINTFNNIRRDLRLKPFKTWHALTGERGFDKDGRDKTTGRICNWKRLELVYGAAPQGIEKLDLLTGDLYEGKIPGFAISETSFIIFLLMASRRLDADPFLNEYLTAEYYTEWGLDHFEKTSGLKDLLERHYPKLAKDFPEDQSAFKPLEGPEAWKTAIDNGIVDPEFKKIWAENKANNDEYFEGLLSKS
jgi:alpha-dioxygenase